MGYKEKLLFTLLGVFSKFVKIGLVGRLIYNNNKKKVFSKFIKIGLIYKKIMVFSKIFIIGR